MKAEKKERWLELCELAALEQDPQKRKRPAMTVSTREGCGCILTTWT